MQTKLGERSNQKTAKMLKSLGATTISSNEAPAGSVVSSTLWLELYAPPVKYVIKNDHMHIVQYIIGDPWPGDQSASEKVLLLVGATGSGKTTLMNAMLNYILGVDYEDNFRFIIANKMESLSHAHSQTKLIAIYKLYPPKSSRIAYPLTIIDTPGYGDTGGIER